jgi:hypothetical protein
MKLRAALCAALLTLAACGPAPKTQAGAETTDAITPPATVASPSISETVPPPPTAAPGVVPVADMGEKGARDVLLAWAHALERGDFDAAYAEWGTDAQARSGMETTEHRQWWARFKTITVATQASQMEGAAGSSYYEAPVTIVGKQRNGKPYRLEGTVTLRRVNDVPGATADQLRWHLEKLDLKSVS